MDDAPSKNLSDLFLNTITFTPSRTTQSNKHRNYCGHYLLRWKANRFCLVLPSVIQNSFSPLISVLPQNRRAGGCWLLRVYFHSLMLQLCFCRTHFPAPHSFFTSVSLSPFIFGFCQLIFASWSPLCIELCHWSLLVVVGSSQTNVIIHTSVQLLILPCATDH